MLFKNLTKIATKGGWLVRDPVLHCPGEFNFLDIIGNSSVHFESFQNCLIKQHTNGENKDMDQFQVANQRAKPYSLQTFIIPEPENKSMNQDDA